MNKRSRILFPTIGNLKSKIKNRRGGMKHIIGLLVMFVILAACGGVVGAQQPKKVPRIGYLSAFDPAT